MSFRFVAVCCAAGKSAGILLVVLEDFVGHSIQDLQSQRFCLNLPSRLKGRRTRGIPERINNNAHLTFHFAPASDEPWRAPSSPRLLRKSDECAQFILAHSGPNRIRVMPHCRAFFARPVKLIRSWSLVRRDGLP